MVSTTVSIPGYRISEELYNGSRTVVYRGYRDNNSLPVVIKLLKNPYPSFSELVQFRNQYTIAKNLNSPLIISTYSLEPYQNGYALVMEDFGGISLKDYFTSVETLHVTSLQEFLEIAIALCNALDILYGERIIHKDIKPANILINPQTKQVKLIDFSIASLLPRETQTLVNPNVLEGTLAYISPEQTGRMNRGIDYRSDFYSLGATFYELLTGELPFPSNDPMELVHCHIAKPAPNLSETGKEIPQVLCDIVSKLMVKNAESRYQSALGLKFDLENCLHQLQLTGMIEGFEIGRRDVCDRFLIPDKLYGRETEVETLLQAFDRVSQGTTEMMLVAGFSGIGKTAVVNEVHKPIVRQRGYFIKGKYDQFNRNIPLSAFVQVFRDLMAQLLSESDTELHIWKTQILQALGDNGQVIIEVIPELERIIGKQAPATELSGTAAQNRFNLLFQKFIQVFTTIEHPLVMFLDDLQWADSASLNLIELLINESESRYLLMIGAYRDNEVSPAHPLMLTLDAVAKANATINTITLGSLSQGSLNQLVADTLNCHILTAQALTELIAVKTKGNPFFATQFLKALYQDGLIQFTPPTPPYQGGATGGWQCDLVEIRTVAMSDDVGEFMASQLQKLPNCTQDILKLAACIGAQFDLKTLAIVSEQSESDAAVALWKALQEGLIIPQSEIYKFYVGELDTTQNTQQISLNYKFLHDRVQQAAYSLIPDDQKQATHLKIGQLLLQDTSPTTREDKVFDIVNHLNVGKSLITEPSQLTELAQLNLNAGRKAKLSTAYGAAIAYYTIGMELLEPDCWQSQYELTLNLYVAATEVAYLNSDFEGMEYLAAKVLQRAQTILDKVKIYDLKIQYLTAQNQLHDSLELGLQILDELNVQIASLKSVKKGVKLPTLSDIDSMVEMRNPYKIAAMQMLISVLPAVFLTTNRFAEFVLTLINLSLEFGRSELACYAYAAYGWLKCGQGEIKDGYHAGKIALKLIEIYDSREFKCKVNLLFAAHIQHWKEHFNNTPSSLLEALKDGLDNGDNEYAGYAAMHLCHHPVWAGEYLPEVHQKQEKYIQIAGKEIAQEFCREFGSIWKQLTENLLCLGKYRVHLIGDSFNENERLSQLIKDNSHNPLVAVYVSKLILHYLYDEYSQALENGNLAYPHTLAIPGVFSVFIHNLFWSLSLLKGCEIVDINTRKNYYQQIDQNQQNLRLWANHAPMNFLHKFHLVEAERHRVLGSKAEAINLYDRAISGAKANEYIQEEALANELAAKFYLDWGKEKVAAGYMQEAYYCYSRWGAKAKTDDLEKRYPELLRPILQQSDPSVTMLGTLGTIATPGYSLHSNTRKSSSSSTINTTLDFAAILKASQALSRTIQLEDLLYHLTQIILQNSGGDRCALILPNENQVWEVRAIATPTATELYSEPLENNPNVPVKLIQYVKNTQQVVVIDDLETDLPVIDDYLRLRQPKSVLCLPILNQGHLVGVLYLKNRLTSGVFTSDRIIILDFLCTQVAISLENARLYNQVQQTLSDLQNAQLQIVQSEKMSALGNLVAGVAHEINNPVGCIIGNVGAVQNSINDLFGLIDLYNDKFPQPGAEIEEELEIIDLEYLRDDLPKLIRAMKDGGDRIKSISKSLRTFSRADSDQKQTFNLHEGIDSTILILRHRLKANETHPAIEVVTNYGQIPAIACFPGQLNQVFMNILANAIDALDESNNGRTFADIQANPNFINIQTSVENERVKIAITDNGKGMSESVKQKIFDHLFTTKAVGKGTGLGLAIARQIVVEKHGGVIEVDSRPGEGTEFVIHLPM